VTSPAGAALHDVLEVTGQRFPSIPIFLSACKVQGEWAERTIEAALRRVALHGGADVVILARGGGNQEDLSAFNDERVARAIAASPMPVVSAVGHEIDVTIADLVADVRAATPSHAAELVVPDRAAFRRLVQGHQRRLVQAGHAEIAARRGRLGRIRLRDPRGTVRAARERLARLETALRARMMLLHARRKSALQAGAGRLDALSPLAVLSRGYAVALHENRVVRSTAELTVGDRLDLRLGQGTAEVEVRSLPASDGAATAP
jgi:exodeoxyribonuclease VII large subunit